MHCPAFSDALTQGLKYVISSRAALPNGKMRLTKLALTRLAALGSRSRTARTVAMGARPAPLAAPPEERSAARGVCFAALRSSRTVEPVSPWGDKRTPQRGEFRRTPKPSSRGAARLRQEGSRLRHAPGQIRRTRPRSVRHATAARAPARPGRTAPPRGSQEAQRDTRRPAPRAASSSAAGGGTLADHLLRLPPRRPTRQSEGRAARPVEQQPCRNEPQPGGAPSCGAGTDRNGRGKAPPRRPGPARSEPRPAPPRAPTCPSSGRSQPRPQSRSRPARRLRRERGRLPPLPHAASAGAGLPRR